ncbi:cyd operon protein YbgT [Rhodovulum sp. ES.010]|nr:cytochrome bd-I oxidase subunit CydX [Rhodovulum sp. ES.010]SIO23042.1 cyd operon protein YbgT [Rhodovulum sp. ES.010]
MWYFAWMLGLPLAALLAVVNAIWLELHEDALMEETGEDAR